MWPGIETRIWVWQQEKMFFFRSSDDIQCKKDSVKLGIEDACCSCVYGRGLPKLCGPF